MTTKKLKISLDSLRDRLEGAELKIRRACPELASFSPSTTYRKNRKGSHTDSWLFDKRAAKSVRPLYRVVNPETGEKREIPVRRGKKRFRKGVDTAAIKAWAHDSTPVPDFSFTDFFAQLIPRGHLTRITSPPTLHDRSSQGCSFAKKLEDHEARNPIPIS